jgi:hypothetical protein
MVMAPVTRKANAAGRAKGIAQRGFSGSLGMAGNSRSFRVEKEFFNAAPEFSTLGSAIRVDIIGPGTFIVRIDTPAPEETADPIIGAWLSFIDGDISSNPGQLVAFTGPEVSELERLVKNVVVDDSHELPEDVTF